MSLKIVFSTMLFRNIRISKRFSGNLSSEISVSKHISDTRYKSEKEVKSVAPDVLTFSKKQTSEKSIKFDKNHDKFGTLSSDRMLRETVEAGDNEVDDSYEEVTYVDEKYKRTRFKPVNYAMMIKQHLKQNKLADALSVLENTMLIEHKAKPDLYIYNLLISGCAWHGYTKKAFQLFNQMKKRGLIPRLSTYTSLFNACANGPWTHDSLVRARHLRELMIEKGVQPNVSNYNAMIKAFGRQGDLETSFSIMDEMLLKEMAIDSITFNFLLQAAASDKEAGFRHALLVWRKMLAMKILPTTFTFNLLLRCTRDCGIGDKESAQQLIAFLFPPEQNTGNELVDSRSLETFETPNLLLPTPQHGSLVSISSNISKPWQRLVLLGSWQGLLATMSECRAQPDIKTFSLLLDVFPPSDKLEEDLLNEMKERNVKLDTAFCNMLIKKRNSSSRFSSALNVMELMKYEQLVPDIMTFGTLALGCNTLATAKRLIQDINNIGYRPNVQILSSLVRRAKVSLDIDMVLFIIRTLTSEDIIPDQKFYGDLIHFRDVVLKNFQLKDNGETYVQSIDNEGYNEKLSRLLDLMEDIKLRIKDPSTVHPWAQFKMPSKVH